MVNAWMGKLDDYAIRRALSVTAAVSVAALIAVFSFWSDGNWMVLSAYLVSQTTRGTPFKQGLNSLFTIIVALLVTFMVSTMSENDDLTLAILVTLFFLVAFIELMQGQSQDGVISLLMLFAFVVLISMLFPNQGAFDVRLQLMDVLIGGAIAMLSAQFIFPVRAANEFCLGVLPILSSIKSYSIAFREAYLDKSVPHDLPEKLKIGIELTSYVQHGMYPEWVYEFGFNPGLRAGFRFFLVNIEALMESMMALDYWGRHEVLDGGSATLIEAMNTVMQNNEALLQVLIQRFSEGTLPDKAETDYMSDVAKLEETLKEVVPTRLDILEAMPSKAEISGMVQDVVDIRKILLQLVKGLPAN